MPSPTLRHYQKINEWIKTATPQSAASMIENGLVSRDELSMQIQKWIHDASFPSVCALVHCGLAQKIDFEKKISRWIDISTPDVACKMIENGMACPGDFKKRLRCWLECPQYSFVGGFIRRYGNEVANEICIDSIRVQRWIESADSNSAFCLIRDGLAVKQDFAERAVAWIDFVGISKLRAMVTVGLISLRVAELRKKVNHEIKLAIASHRMPSAEEKQRWLSCCNVTSLIEIVNSGLIDRNDAVERVNFWKVHATPKVACLLVASNFAQATDFGPLVEKWMNSLSPNDALALIKSRVIGQDNVVKLKASWRKNVAPVDLLSLLRLGCVTTEEAADAFLAWRDEIPKEDRNKLAVLLMQEKLVRGRFSDKEDGLVVRGRVKNFTEFGAFIDLLDFDGICGLLHITDMSWKRIKHPDELLKVGQEINVKVIGVDKERARISLGLKQLTDNPWDTVLQKFPVGTRVQGKVKNIAKYGAFVEIASNIEGLVHNSELSWTKRDVRASDMLAVGDEVQVVVLSVDVENQKIALGIRQTLANPWDTVQKRFLLGSKVKGKVRNFTVYGAFVELEEGIDGMIHVSDMSWTRKINHPSECLQKGQEVETVVLDVNPKKHRISLGLKQVQANPWGEIAAKYPVGSIVKGKVTKIASFGAFVELEDGVDGLMHISQISDQHVTKVKDVLVVGQEVEARVVKVDSDERHIGLSIRAMSMTDEEFKALYADKESLPQEDVSGKKAVGDIHE